MAGPGSTTSQPAITAQDMYKRILEQEQQIRDLREELTNRTSKPKLKVKEPEVFKGEQEKLKPFITQAELYLKYYDIEVDSDKILTIAIFLKGDAFDWFEPRIRDFIDNDKAD